MNWPQRIAVFRGSFLNYRGFAALRTSTSMQSPKLKCLGGVPSAWFLSESRAGAFRFLLVKGASLAMAGPAFWRRNLAKAPFDVLSALSSYEQRLRPTAEETVKAGRNMAKWFVPDNWAYLAVRDILTRFIGWPGANYVLKRAFAASSVLGVRGSK
jgi:hypothetical protein